MSMKVVDLARHLGKATASRLAFIRWRVPKPAVNFIVWRMIYSPVSYDWSPWTPFEGSLAEARLALITTGGVYVGSAQEPFVDNDPSFRAIPSSTSEDDLAIFHRHYDNSHAEKDINVVYPIDRLRDMEAEGIIGSVAENNVGFMGSIHGKNIRRLTEQTASEAAQLLLADNVTAALIGTT